jgi:outer membrane lipoprotein-sorting protein
MRRLSTRGRWAVPIGTVAAVGVVIAVSAVASAAEPLLPARTPAQLLTEVQQAAAKPLGPFTATVQEIANLGLPALPQAGALGGQSGPASAANPLAGTTTVNIWYLNPQHIRIAEPAPLGETDLRLDGTKLWLWSSKTQTATQVLLPAGLHPRGPHAIPQPGATVQSPGAAVRQLLKAVGPSTSVRVGPNATVAGHAAYLLAIAPKGSGSLVSQIVIAVDARTHIPLRVQVFARDSSGPAFQLGFTSLTFGAPAASNFTFTPPPGAKVKTEKVPAAPPTGLIKGLSGLGTAGLGAAGSSPAEIIGGSGTGAYSSKLHISISGAGSAAPAPLPPAVARQLRATMIAQLPKTLKGAQRREAVRELERSLEAGSQTSWISSAGPASPPPGLGAGTPKVLGSGWTSVITTPANPAVAAAVRQLLAARTTAMLGGAQSLTNTPVAAGQVQAVPVGPDLAVLRAVLKATTAVKGSWGSGRLLRTTLLTVLITSKGQILAGAVTPSVLYADAASLSR